MNQQAGMPALLGSATSFLGFIASTLQPHLSIHPKIHQSATPTPQIRRKVVAKSRFRPTMEPLRCLQNPKFSSGFEEEFNRAVERREKTGSPEISLFFKDVIINSSNEIDDQLKRVLAFRELIASKTLLFRNFSGIEDWKKQTRDLLHMHSNHDLETLTLTFSHRMGEGTGGCDLGLFDSGFGQSRFYHVRWKSGGKPHALQALREVSWAGKRDSAWTARA
jgi:hypothetical protein